ncbi:MAG: hypothetical protein J7L66_03620 [Anaerolineaceae bacterium]|nr:hypothetical protein [Anaerolineaceae bacterium]
MRGFEYIPSSIGLECLLFPSKWFTRTIHFNNYRTSAIAQVEMEYQGGRLLWALNVPDYGTAGFSFLLNNLAQEAGKRGAHFLTASIEKKNAAFELFMKAGYSYTSWETVFQYQPDKSMPDTLYLKWRKTLPVDLIAINQLQNKLLTAKEKIIVPPLKECAPNYALFSKDILCGYAYATISFNKAYITPFVDPELPDKQLILNMLINKYFRGRNLFYIKKTPSQSWMELTFSVNTGPILPRREIIVKHLAVREKGMLTNFNYSTHNRHTDIITSAVNTSHFKDNI